MPMIKDAYPCWNQGMISTRDEQKYMTTDQGEKSLKKPSVLLHSCCGPCSTAVIEQLAPDFDITVFFYNPNITDEEEYHRRLESQKDLIRQMNDNPDFPHRIGFSEGPYHRQRFFEVASGYEEEPEGGARCANCFLLRLDKTAGAAKLLGYDFFATTLSISPHKDYDTISHIGRRLAITYGVSFLDRNFKKKDGFRRSVELAKAYGLYRQTYCGCIHSRKKEEK